MSRIRTHAAWLAAGVRRCCGGLLAAGHASPATQPPKAEPPLLPPLAQPTAPDFATVIDAHEGRQARHREEARRPARGPLRPRRPAPRDAKMTRGKPVQAGPAREAARRARPGTSSPR